MRSQFEKEFDRLGICGKEILPGEIWTVKDEIIIIPETRLPGFKGTEHEYRPIVILSCQEDCKDPQTITVVICPLTTRTDIVHQTDCFLSVMEGSVKEESLAHLGLIQPILKADLVEKKGQLTKEQFDSVKTIILMNFGFIPRTEP